MTLPTFVQFPRRSLIVCIPVVGISNFHGCIDEVTARTESSDCAINLFPLWDTRRIVILHLRCQITMMDRSMGCENNLAKKIHEDGGIVPLVSFLKIDVLSRNLTRLRKLSDAKQDFTKTWLEDFSHLSRINWKSAFAWIFFSCAWDIYCEVWRG